MIGPHCRAIRVVVAGGLVASAMAFGWAQPAAADWLADEHQLTTGPATQDGPQLDGTNLVYADHANERTVGAGDDTQTLFDIKAIDLRTGRAQILTPGHTALGRPAISGTRVVWSDYGTGADRGIRYHDLATGKARRLDARPGTQVRISGNRICYEYQGRIRVHDLGTGRDRAVSPAGSAAGACDISGRTVVWQEHRNGNDSDIYAYDLVARRETRLTRTASEQSRPRIDGNVVVWQDEVGANVDVYVHDLASGEYTRITADDAIQWFPDIADGRVVWMDERDGHQNTEVYLYDLASRVETRVTHHEGWSGNPTISGNAIVYEDSHSDGPNLFTHRITPPRLSLAVTPGSNLRPVVAGHLLGADGRPVAEETVSVEVSAAGGAWVPVGTAVTSQGGRFSITFPATAGNLRVRAAFAGTPEYPPAVSGPIVLAGVGSAAGLRGALP